jgi:S-adenosylmethionine synthetase
MKLITAESVSIGHPDKVADQISDAILDAYLTLDPDAKVAVETLVKDNCVVLGGEISSTHRINYEEVIKNTVKEIGYTNPAHGFYYKNITIINLIGQQSREINSAVLKYSEDSLGAGDQGFMTGYATNETKTYMPIGMYVSKKLVDYVYNNIGFGPDIKTQTTIEYDDNSKRIHTILVSTMHSEDLTLSNVRQIIMKGIRYNEMNLDADIFALIDDSTSIVINPAGSWNVGGPEIAYMIGVSTPASLSINTYGKFNDELLINVVKNIFPTTPSDVIKHFNLKTPIYYNSAKGHFGNDTMPWEKLDMADKLKYHLKLSM